MSRGMTSDSNSVGRDRLGKLSVELANDTDLGSGLQRQIKRWAFRCGRIWLADSANEAMRCVQEHLQGRECDAWEV